MTHTNRYTSDSIMARGFEIYDGWVDNRSTSREIVAFVRGVIKVMREQGTKRSCAEALACLFALDLRVEQRYKSILNCILAFFSWRREVRTLNLLRKVLGAPQCEDVRTAIEVVIHGIRERMSDQELEELDDYDDTHGGRNTKMDGDEAEATEDTPIEDAPEDTAEKSAEEQEKSEEASEEQIEERSRDVKDGKTATEEQIEEQSASTEQAETEFDDVKEHKQVQDGIDSNVASNGNDREAEPINNNKEQQRTYNDAVDDVAFDLFGETSTEKAPEQKLSFIDEVIIDNMVKGVDDIIWHNPLDDIVQANEQRAEERARASEDNRDSFDKEHHYDDERVSSDTGFQREEQMSQRGDNAQAQNEQTMQTNQTAPKEQTAQSNQPAQGNQTSQSNQPTTNETKDDHEEIRVPIQVNMSNGDGEETEVTFEFTEEMILAIKAGLEAEAHERLNVAEAEYEMNHQVKIAEQVDVKEVRQQSTAPERK